ncbi:MAG: response regulator [candidate division Zixibacteria bacterium]|nr:response regulator [candidate division Zixibacteria bacterium]
MPLEKDYGYTYLISGYQQPLPPESRKGWLVVFSALAVLIFGIWAIDVVSAGLDIHSARENLNQALQMEDRLLDALRNLDRPAHDVLESYQVSKQRKLLTVYRQHFQNIRSEFVAALSMDAPMTLTVSRLDSIVVRLLAEAERTLDAAEMRERLRRAGAGEKKVREMETLAGSSMARMGQHFSGALEILRKIERKHHQERAKLIEAQTGLFKNLYLLAGISFSIGLLAVWLLMRVRIGQKRERGVSESLSRTLAEVKATEEALRQSNERFHLAASATSGVIYDRDIEKNSIVWTENITAVFGYPLEEVEPAHKWWEERLHPSDLTRIQLQLKENLTVGKDFIAEYRFRHKDGHYVDVWDKGRVVQDGSGQVVRMVGSMVDVSEQKRVEKALRAIAVGISSSTGVNFFRSLVRHLATALGVKYALVGEIADEKLERVQTIAVWSGEGFNENFEYELAGTPCENVVGQSMCLYASGIQQQFPDDLILKKMGAESYLGTPLFDSAGKPLGILAVLHHEPLPDEFDMRSILNIFAVRAAAELERKRTEEALLQSEERFRSIFENASAGMVTITSDGRYLQVNPAFCRWLGYSERELLGMAVLDVTHLDDFEKTHSVLREINAGKRPAIELEMRYVRKDGQVVWGHVSAAWLYDTEGKPLYGVSLIQDVTERKRAVEELACARDAALEQANLKSQFLANMSHEIRTPMNGVLGYLGLLSSRAFADEGEMAEFVRGAKSSAETLLGIINDILDFSKIEAGKLSLESIEFDLRTVVEDTASLLAPKAEQKGLELACLVEFGVPLALKGDPTRLRQVLINLTGNAVKFTEKGEIVIRASLLAEDEKNARIRFSVKDTGIGIPPDKHHLLFQSFTQVDGSSTRRFGGTGLGLAISRQLVELMGGIIGFQSEPGQGSEFWFEVTLSKNLTARPRLASADIRSAAILVVDDNSVNRDILCRMVESFGCRAFSAGRSAEGMKVLQKQLTLGDPIRAAIIDFQMPEENGEELAKKIKSHPALEPTFLVLLTSVGTRGDALRAKQAGFAAYLHKPVKQSQLLEAISAVLSRSKGREKEQPLITRHWLEEAKRGGSILVAEDNQVNRAVAEAVLSRAGYSVVCVKDGREALEVFSVRDFDLILMDVQMPEMDGMEATREIRKMTGAKSRIPVIAMTAHALSGDKEKCLKAGMNDYVSKPIEPLELREVVERWMARRPLSPVSEKGESGAAPPVDWARLEQSSGGDAAFRRQLTEVFLADGEARLGRVNESLRAKNFERIGREAHSIKGAAANFGAAGLSRLAAGLEEQAGEKALSRCRELAKQMIKEFERVRGSLVERKVKPI